MFKKERIKYVNIDEMNEHLKFVQQYYNIFYGKKPNNKCFKKNAYIEDLQVRFRLTYRKGTYTCTYECRKDDKEKCNITGMEAYKTLKQYAHIPDLTRNDHTNLYKKELGWVDTDTERKFGCATRAVLDFNSKYEGKRVNAISYDLNSAYSYGMLQTMPDTSKLVGYMRNLEKGEIGFRLDSNNRLTCITEVGRPCRYIFKEQESPFKRFVEVWYNKKKDAPKGSLERQKAKDVLTYCVGYLQKKNPFIRCRIITYCNELITSLLDKDSLYWNTDSIVSLKPRDFKVGDNVGEWKIEHQGLFAFKGMNYQWDYEKPSYRGVNKNWFKKGWDILKDPMPTEGNLYYFNKEKIKLCEKSKKLESSKK